MTDLRDRLDDLVAGVPAYVAADPAAAWRKGRHRLLRRRIVSAAAAVLALAALGVAVRPTADSLPPADGGAERVSGHPQRIGHQWGTSGLPDRPGPIAGLLADGRSDWYAVSPKGVLWRMPKAVQFDVHPTLSDDGRYLGYFFNPTVNWDDPENQGEYVIQDLVTGRKTTYAGRRVEEQSPGFWSPDGHRVASMGAVTQDSSGSHAVILGADGTEVRVPAPAVGAQLAGWAGDATLVWATGRAAILTGLDGAVASSATFRPPLNLAVGPGQNTAVVSGDRIIYGNAVGSTSEWHTFRLSDGVETTAPVVSERNDNCPVTLQRGTPVLPDFDGSHVNTVSAVGGPPLVAVDPVLGASCLYLAPDAIDGHAVGGLFGRTQAPWTWWWREILAGLGFLVLLSTAVVYVRRRGLPPARARGFGMRGWVGGPPWVGR